MIVIAHRAILSIKLMIMSLSLKNSVMPVYKLLCIYMDVLCSLPLTILLINVSLLSAICLQNLIFFRSLSTANLKSSGSDLLPLFHLLIEFIIYLHSGNLQKLYKYSGLSGIRKMPSSETMLKTRPMTANQSQYLVIQWKQIPFKIVVPMSNTSNMVQTLFFQGV